MLHFMLLDVFIDELQIRSDLLDSSISIITPIDLLLNL